MSRPTPTLRELACELATLGGTIGRRRLASRHRQRNEPGDDGCGDEVEPTPMSSPSTTGQPRRRSSRCWWNAGQTTRSSARRAPQRPGTSGLSWYLDPIDGTTNFLYGLPLWSTSVGVTDARGAVAGAVFVPVTGELFAAARGAGATRNGQRIRASSETDASLALVATGFGYLPARRAEQARRLATLIEHIRDIRRGGSAAIDLCYAAAGMVDAYFEDGLNSWDVVAGELIAREAGCRTGDFAGGPGITRRTTRRASGAVRATGRPARGAAGV